MYANEKGWWVTTVTGPMPPEALGVTDAHNHVWIKPLTELPGMPILVGAKAIERELADYRTAGGCALVDCQPGRAGRDATMLRRFAEASQVAIVACTGFHLRKYYPAAEFLWMLPADVAADHFIRELTVSMEEAAEDMPIRAGAIKIACEATLAASPAALMAAAAHAAAVTGVAIEIHTEKGAAAEDILRYFTDAGVAPRQLVICHVDKRPDFGLHRELATAGALLEYDTFYRPKYDPEQNVWPLLAQMAEAGLDRSVAIATDMAESDLWKTLGGGPGLVGLLTLIRPRLLAMGIAPDKVANLLGGNIARRLVPHQPVL